MKFERIDYQSLSAKQQEIFNFQKIAGVLADYGFNCIKLADDWLGADFLAYHKDGVETLKVQLKSRLTIDKKYQHKGLHIAFPLDGGWCLIDHDELVNIIGKATGWLETPSWNMNEQYHSAKPSQKLIAALQDFIVGRNGLFGQLFENEPTQWGLRGDPHLWQAMREHFKSTVLPAKICEIDELIETAFHKLTEYPISSDEAFLVERFAYGGMSSGMISPAFWRETAIPLLRYRYANKT